MAITNNQLVNYARGQLGRYYWYGCYGQKSSVELYYQKKKQWGDKLSGSEESYLEQAAQHVKVHDCAGLIKGAFWCAGVIDADPKYQSNNVPDVSANDMIKLCTETGNYNSIPNIPGLIVWKNGHVGVYCGEIDGKKTVCQAKGHAYGVVLTTSGTPWEKWGKLPASWVTYKEPEPVPVQYCKANLPVLDSGSKGNAVKRVQLILNWLGVKDDAGKSLSIDGNMGPKTCQAVQRFKVSKGLYNSPEVNTYTWQALIDS